MADINEILLTDLRHKKDFIKADGSGDLETISGLDNLKEAILRRIMTTPGSLVHRPEYGVGLKQFQNAPMTIATQREIARRINAQLLRDSRIASVNSVQIDIDRYNPAKMKIIVSVTPKGFEEAVAVAIPFGEVS